MKYIQGIVGGIVLVVGVFLLLPTSVFMRSTIPDTKTALINERVVELGTIELDLKEFPHLSDKVRTIMFTTIDSVSKEHNIPPLLMHLVFRVESAYRFWIEHPKVTVSVNGVKTPIQATSLGGVVWEFWADTLKKADIAQTRSDLFIPEVNIRATGLILSILAERAIKTGNEVTILPILISKYYGQFDKDYETKMQRYSSDLFWKRISREIMNLRNK
jgi:hypothetical protein